MNREAIDGIVRRFRGQGVDVDDLNQEAALAAFVGAGDVQRIEWRLRDVVRSARRRVPSTDTQASVEPCQEVIADAAAKWAGLTDAQRSDIADL